MKVMTDSTESDSTGIAWKESGEYADIRYETSDDGIAKITICRPEVHNAFRPQTIIEISAALTAAREDPAVGVIILTGEGDKAFCSGGDVSDQSSRTPDVGRTHMRRLFALSSVMRMMDKPILAKIRGYCVGGGNEIHLFCDMSFAGEKAIFGQTGPRVGSIPIWGACQLLARYVGERKAREMVFGCRQYTAQQAVDMGLINFVCKEEALDALVDEWCQEILNKSPQSIRIAKLALNAGSDQDFYPSYFPTSALLASIYGNEENSEGTRAFLEKRKPDFRRYRRKGL